MNYDYSKRGYLLPKGCKDLIDVLKQEAPMTPAVKTAVTEKGFFIAAQIIGFDSAALEITVEGRTLRITGKRCGSPTPFETNIDVPAGYDLNQARAAYFSGELRITIPTT